MVFQDVCTIYTHGIWSLLEMWLCSRCWAKWPNWKKGLFYYIWIRMILSVDLSKRSYLFHLHCNGESFPKLYVVVSSNLGNITSMSLSLKPNDYNLDKSIRQIDYILLVGYLATLSCWATISLCWLPVRTQEVSLKFSTTWRRFSSTVVQWPIGPCGTTGWCQQFCQPFKHLTGSEMCERLRGSQDVYNDVCPHCKCGWLWQWITYLLTEVWWRWIANIKSLVGVTRRSSDSDTY